MHVVKNIEIPTTLYVLGTDVNKEPETFSLTDDYQTLDIKGLTTDTMIETDGFVFILTKEELIRFYDAEKIENSDSLEVMVLENYTGELKVALLDEDGNDYLKEEFDPREYMMYQTKNEDDDLYTTPTLVINCEIGKTYTVEECLNILYSPHISDTTK